MAKKYGNTVSGSSYRWYVVLDVSQIASTSTSVTLRVKAQFYTRWTIYSYANGSLDGDASGTWSGSTRDLNGGRQGTTTFLTRDVKFTRRSEARTVGFEAMFRVTGGFGNGTSRAELSYTVPAVAVVKPDAPSGMSSSRVSDKKVKSTWENNPDGTQGRYDNVLIERSVDGGSYVQIKKLSGTVENYTDGTTSANHRYRYRVRAHNSAGYSGYSTGGYVYTTPAAPTSVTLSRTGESSILVGVKGAPKYATSYDVQKKLMGGEWEEVADGTSLPVTDSVGEGVYTYRVRANVAGLSSAWRESAQIALNAPPLAPAITARPAEVVPTGFEQAVAWSPNHPDGSPQEAAQVEVTVGATAAQTHDVSGAATEFQIPATALAVPAEVSVRVRTKGMNDDWGEWSEYVAFSVAVPPAVSITYPATDGYVAGSVPVNVTWDVEDETGVSYQVLSVRDADGAEVYSSELTSDVRTFALGASSYLPLNFEDYEVEVSVYGGSGLSASDVRAFTMDYAEPALPAVEVEYDVDLSATVTVAYGEDGWVLDGTTLVSPEDNGTDDGVPITAGASETEIEGVLELGEVSPTVDASVVCVLPDGTQSVLAESLGDGESAFDRLPPLNVDYRYVVTVYAETGTATSLDVEAYADSGGMECYNFGPDAGLAVLLGLDAASSEGIANSGETFHFALGADTPQLPTFYPDGTYDVTGNHSYKLTRLSAYKALREAVRARDHALCWYRDGWGRRAFGVADWTLSYDAQSHSLWNASCKFTECVWEEPQNG